MMPFLPELKSMPGHLVRRAHQLASAIFNDELAPYDLTSVQFIALVAISETIGMDATRLSETIHFDRATIGGVVERLEKKGLIVRQPGEHDRRTKVLRATPAGKALITVSRDRVKTVQDRLLAPLDAGEREQLVSLLCRVVGSSLDD